MQCKKGRLPSTCLPVFYTDKKLIMRPRKKA